MAEVKHTVTVTQKRNAAHYVVEYGFYDIDSAMTFYMAAKKAKDVEVQLNGRSYE